jgi:hypothetical protein
VEVATSAQADEGNGQEVGGSWLRVERGELRVLSCQLSVVSCQLSVVREIIIAATQDSGLRTNEKKGVESNLNAFHLASE